MTRSASPKLTAYAALAALGLLAALALRAPELVALAAPFAVLPAVGLVLAREPRIAVALRVDRERSVEGDDLELAVELGAEVGAERLDVLVDLPPELRVVEGDNPAAIRLGDGDFQTLRLLVRCERWGAYRPARIVLRAHDLFGVLTYEEVIDACRPLKVYPREEAIRALLRPLETQVFSGNHVARQKGDGIEFADLRRFVPGDRIRHVNWRATARRSELWVNEHHAERNADVVIFLDSFAEARLGERSTLDLSLRAAASLAARYLRQKDRVGFVTFGGMVKWLLPGTGTVQLYRMVDSLLDTQIVLSYAWKDLEVIPRRTLPPHALVVALTPLLDDRAATALLDLRGRGFDLVVVEVSPLPFVGPAEGGAAEVARRIWPLRREAVRGRFERAGAPVVVWDDDETSFAAALEEVTAFRRYARLARV